MFNMAHLTPLDYLSLALLFCAWATTGWLVERPPKWRPSVTLLMRAYRREWMQVFVSRQPRIFDATVIDSLRQGTAFFASACMIAIGGGLALIGNTAPLEQLASDLSLDTQLQVTAQGGLLEVKVLVVLLFLANALLKFIWAHRLFGYCSILMASVPNDPKDPMAHHRASQAAEVNITAAKGFNRGLQSIYYALGALGWLLGPIGLMIATLMASAVVIRREFASSSRQVILQRDLPR